LVHKIFVSHKIKGDIRKTNNSININQNRENMKTFAQTHLSV